jgi:hypothetical protein
MPRRERILATHNPLIVPQSAGNPKTSPDAARTSPARIGAGQPVAR